MRCHWWLRQDNRAYRNLPLRSQVRRGKELIYKSLTKYGIIQNIYFSRTIKQIRNQRVFITKEQSIHHCSIWWLRQDTNLQSPARKQMAKSTRLISYHAYSKESLRSCSTFFIEDELCDQFSPSIHNVSMILFNSFVVIWIKISKGQFYR